MVPPVLHLLVAFFLVGGLPAWGQMRSVLAPPPKWEELEQFQETITRDDFVRLLDTVYAPGGAAKEMIEVQPDQAVIKTTLEPATTWTLRFAASAEQAKPVPRFWRETSTLPPAPIERPLAGVKIAIDPGHIGGAWARMEERHFQIGNTAPVMEGEMTLKVAELMEPQLRALGAEVTLVRRRQEPVTDLRPDKLQEAALAELERLGVQTPTEGYQGPADPAKWQSIQWQSELLFYRTAEIRKRAEIVNDQIRPDLTICLHFNAEPWGDPKAPQLVDRNHFHVLLNGCYSAGELRYDDIRLDMLMKLLSRCLPEELAVSTTVADYFGKATGLPPYVYNTPNAIRVGESPYVWARNLLANRLYRTPVLFMEPYVMNSQEVWERVQAGDYEGERMVAGQNRKSIYREYADALVNGLREYFAKERKH